MKKWIIALLLVQSLGCALPTCPNVMLAPTIKYVHQPPDPDMMTIDYDFPDSGTVCIAGRLNSPDSAIRPYTCLKAGTLRAMVGTLQVATNDQP